MRLACSGLFSSFEKSPEKNVTVVLPSRFLASVGYRHFVAHQLRAGHDSWRRPRFLSLSAWLTGCWHEARYHRDDVPALLSPSQEHFLWKRIVQRESHHLFDANATARLASRAARTLAEWELPAESPHWQDGSDALQFQRWLKLFRHACRQEGWISRAELWPLLPAWFAQKSIARKTCAAGEIAFLNSRPAFPALQRVCSALDRRASVASFRDSPPEHPTPAKSFDNFDRELDFAARWARHAFEHDASKTVGIFVPDLPAHRQAVARVFRQVFYPGACRALLDPGSMNQDEPLAFNLNAPAPLASQPIVAGALLLLELARPRILVSDAGAILRSTWIVGAPDERAARALADLEIRKRRDLDVSLDDLVAASVRCPRLARIWPRVRQLLQNANPLDTFAGWSRFIGTLLHALGWPGDHELSTAEQEAVEAWKNALSQLGALSLVAESVTFESAIEELRRLLQAGFEQGSLASPIQILDASQASGLQFDSALLAGLSEETWPPPSFGSPLLPLKLQREHHVPGSTPPGLRAERQHLTASLFAVAPDLVATWSSRPSPLLAGFVPSKSTHPAFWTGNTPWQSFKPALLEQRDDSLAPPFAAKANTRGGTSVIKSQSLCPFRAFAEFRLNAASPEEGCLGLDGRERGGNLHKALEFVWQKLRTRDRLRAMAPLALHNLVESAAREAVSAKPSSPFGKIVTSVEIERLKAVILDWLSVERERQQNFSVETVEEEKYFDLAGLRLRLRLDRIDRLSNGDLLLIDYKSGDQTAKKLEGERPAEPQLFVYAAALEENVAGLFFGQLKPREPKLKGISKSRHVAGQGNQVKKDWEAFLLAGENSVYRLAEQFAAGYAPVDPLPHACDYCAQKPLCRINESRHGEEAEE